MLSGSESAPPRPHEGGAVDGAHPAGPSRRWRWRGARAVGAVLAGLGLYATFPPLGLWWLGPPAVALWLVVVSGSRFRAALGWSVLAAVAYQWPLLSWTGEFVGPVWLLLLATLTVFVAVPAAATTLVARLPGAPVWQACVWIAGEALIERWPFQGFAWAKLAFGQADGVLAPLARLGGAPLVSFGVVLTGAAIASLVLGPRRRAVVVVAVVALLVAPVAGLLTLPAVRAAPAGPSITVAAVQGNVPRAGLDFAAQRRAVLDNHVTATGRLAADVAAGRVARPDLVIWPENSSDIDPLANADARAEIQDVTDRIGVPVVVGAVLRGTTSDNGPRNTAIVWQPRVGPGAQYTKRHIMPFGEYIPFKSIAQLLVGVDLSRYQDFVPGGGPGVLPTGPARLGVATCYEVVFDDDVRSAVRAGADLLTVPTNNATFGFTDMTYQQQAMSRLRAVEHDRAVVIAATSGQSAIIDPAGRVVARTGALFTPGVLVSRVPLLTTTTPATALGAAPELVLAGVGVVALAVGIGIGTARRRGRAS